MGGCGANIEMANALNDFFASQAELDGTCLVDYVQFDTNYEMVFEDKPVAEAKAVIEPRALTALLDAIGQGTVDLGKKLAAMPEDRRPGKVMVVVVTDGYENASVRYSQSKVRELVTIQQDQFNWDYVFLGANMDAVTVGGGYGFKAEKSLTFNIHDPYAVGATSAVLDAYTTTYRGGGDAGFSDEDRQKATGS